LAGGLNLYGFAGGDPINYSDPFGLCPPEDNENDCATRFWADRLASGEGSAAVNTVMGVLAACGESTCLEKIASLWGGGRVGLTTEEVPEGFGPKPGEVGGPGSGKDFSPGTKAAARTGRCVFCGAETTQEPGPRQSNIDHAVPKSKGGNNTLNNAQETCRTCNLKKGTKTTDEFLQNPM